MKKYFTHAAQVVFILSAIAIQWGCSVKNPQQAESQKRQAELQQKQEEVKQDIDKYNRLAEKYNNLMDDAYESTKLMAKTAGILIELDHNAKICREIQDFITDNFYSLSHDELGNQMKTFEEETKKALETITTLEKHFSDKHKTQLIENADKVFRSEDIAAQQQLYEKQAEILSTLSGLRNIFLEMHNDLVKKVNDYINLPAAPQSRKEVQLNKSEREIIEQTQTSQGAVASERNGSKRILTGIHDIQAYAQARGFDAQASEHAFKLSSQSQAIMGFAETNEELAEAINNMIAHMKVAINSNADALELVFVLDDSGSMDDDIAGVVRNLIKITDSLQAVSRADRPVRIGIVTFGMPTSVEIQLDLTSDLDRVKAKLNEVLAAHTGENSTDPGEASYHGLQKAVDEISWDSQNRKIILVTDEPSHEVLMGDTQFVDRLESKLNDSNTRVSIYPIIVKN